MTGFHFSRSVIDTGTARINVVTAGAGAPTLVFLHYWGGSSRTWQPVIERLALTARCVAIDHRGWGRSSAPATGYDIDDLAADASTVIEALRLDEYILVGHSMGGKVAQLLASRPPRSLRGVVLVAPAPAKPVAVPLAVRSEMARSYRDRRSVSAVLDGVLTHAELSPELREQVIQDSLAGSPGAKHQWPAAAIVEDVSEGLGAISVPVLVISGSEDRVEPIEIMEDHVLAEIPGARLEILEACGHLVPLEQPDRLSELIRAFTNGLAR